MFIRSVFFKETCECIGRISCHERNVEDDSIDDPSVRGVGWLIDTKYQGLGYATEDAKEMIDYMFFNVKLKKLLLERL